MKAKILNYLPIDYPWKDHIQVFDTIDSTNTRLKEMARKGAPEGTVLVADTQTGGRGRMGRSFHCAPGKGIYLSLLLRPRLPAAQLMHLTCTAGVAVCNATEAVTGFRPGIKWINDLVAGNQKMGGILTEMSIDAAGNAEWAVIGIGINCAHSREDFPPELRHIATSLELHTGKPCNREQMIATLMAQLYTVSGALVSGRTGLMEAYRRDCITLGKEIQVIRGDTCENAQAMDVLEDGALLVRYPDHREDAVNSGEVSIRGMYGYIS